MKIQWVSTFDGSELLPPRVSSYAHIIQKLTHLFGRIMNRIPFKLTQYTDIIDANVDEVKNDYMYGTKKSVVNFILGKPMEKTYKIDASADRSELHAMRKRFMIK